MGSNSSSSNLHLPSYTDWLDYCRTKHKSNMLPIELLNEWISLNLDHSKQYNPQYIILSVFPLKKVVNLASTLLTNVATYSDYYFVHIDLMKYINHFKTDKNHQINYKNIIDKISVHYTNHSIQNNWYYGYIASLKIKPNLINDIDMFAYVSGHRIFNKNSKSSYVNKLVENLHMD